MLLNQVLRVITELNDHDLKEGQSFYWHELNIFIASCLITVFNRDS